MHFSQSGHRLRDMMAPAIMLLDIPSAAQVQDRQGGQEQAPALACSAVRAVLSAEHAQQHQQGSSAHHISLAVPRSRQGVLFLASEQARAPASKLHPSIMDLYSASRLLRPRLTTTSGLNLVGSSYGFAVCAGSRIPARIHRGCQAPLAADQPSEAFHLHTIPPISVCRQGKPWHVAEHARQRFWILQ